MRRGFYLAGRTLEIAGLIALPSSMVVAEFARDEKNAILIFLCSVGTFATGYVLTLFSGGR